MAIGACFGFGFADCVRKSAGQRAWLEYPAAEMGGCWMYMRSRLMLVDDKMRADVERIGAIVLPLVV